jgi:hypothetical protein
MLYDEHLDDIERRLVGAFERVLDERDFAGREVFGPRAAARFLDMSYAKFRKECKYIRRSKSGGEYRYTREALLEYLKEREMA